MSFVRASTQHITTTFANPSNAKTLFAVFNQTNSINYDSTLTFDLASISLSANVALPQTGLTIPGIEASTTTVSTPFGQWVGVVGAHNVKSCLVVKNAEAGVAQTFTNTPVVTGTLSIGIHRLPSLGLFEGKIAFVAVANANLPESQMQAFYALYKSTLGQGLGLP